MKKLKCSIYLSSNATSKVNNVRIDFTYTIFSDGAGTLEIDNVDDIKSLSGKRLYHLLLNVQDINIPIDSYYSLISQLFKLMSKFDIECLHNTISLGYMPYGRADRDFTEGIVSPRGVFMDFIEDKFDYVKILDVHSPIPKLDRVYVENIPLEDITGTIFDRLDTDLSLTLLFVVVHWTQIGSFFLLEN